VELKDAVRRLYKFAPAVLSLTTIVRKEPKPGEETEEDTESNQRRPQPTTDEYPVCWFEDEDTQIALRWHLFAGCLWDMKGKPKSLPWKIRLHFTQYPSSQILPLEGDVMTGVQRSYKNALKQALFLQHGTAKVALGLNKQSHEQIWDAIIHHNYKLFQHVNEDIYGGSNFLPVRVFIDARPPIQRRVSFSHDLKLGCLLVDWAPTLFRKSDEVSEPTSSDIIWAVQGLQIPLESKLVDIWSALCHPDHFLYIIVVSR
jgi:autophagy-related protein 5